MNEYNKKRNLGSLDSFNVLSACSFKPFAKCAEDVVLENYWVPVLIKLPLIEDTKNALKAAIKGLESLSIADLKGTEALL
jgi:hypothetical protein